MTQGSIFCILYSISSSWVLKIKLNGFPPNNISEIYCMLEVIYIYESYEAVSEWVTEKVSCEDKTHSTGLTMSVPDILVQNEQSSSQLSNHAKKLKAKHIPFWWNWR